MSTLAKILIIILTVSILFLGSCSPQKRLATLIKHNPELVLSKTDTTIIHDTIKIPASTNTTIISANVDSFRKVIDGYTLLFQKLKDRNGKDSIFIIKTINQPKSIVTEKTVVHNTNTVTPVVESKRQGLEKTIFGISIWSILLAVLLAIFILILIKRK